MIDKILTTAGVLFRRARFMKPPQGTYAVYLDDTETDGADVPGAGVPYIVRHAVTVELYEPAPDDDAEQAVEAAILAAGLHFTKQDRYWLQDVQRYQVVYDFSYTEKRRG